MNQESSPETVTVTVADLKNVLVLVDLFTQRGALRASELTSVGALYEKIEKFVRHAEQNVSADNSEKGNNV